MIQLLRYREIIAEIAAKVNQEAEADEKIKHCVMAVKEEHLQKKIADKSGVLLCASFPDAEMHRSTEDNYSEDNIVLLFVIEKVNAGQMSEEKEFLHYAKMQRVTERVKAEMQNNEQFCEEILTGKKIRTEWEYNVYGGYNGLSLGLTLENFE